jgi:peptidoglycan/LPS O-acetylase OafA/YrhL
MTDRTAARRPDAGPAAPDPGAAASLALARPISAGRNPGLDGLRVIAAMAVLLTHVGGQTGFEFTGSPASWVVDRGDVGVPIFFVLSGLLLYRPWARAVLDGEAGPAVGRYLCRRALRILPAYWLVVIIALITLSHAHIRSVSTWIQYLLLVQNYNQHPWWDGTGANGLAQMWSLVIEVSFYLILPLLAVALARLVRRGAASVARRARRLLTGLGVLAASSYGFAVLMYPPFRLVWLNVTLPRYVTWFAAGMALAVVAEWARAEPAEGPATRLCATVAASAGACWLIAAVAFAIACTPLTGPELLLWPSLWQVEIKIFLYTVIAIALVAPVAFQPNSATWVSRALGNGVMGFLGRVSYGIFLWQFVIIYGFYWAVHAKTVWQGTFYPWPTAVGILIACTAATLIAAILSFYVVEQPAQRLYRVLYRPRFRPTRPPGGSGALAGQSGQEPGNRDQAQQLRPDVP